MSTREQQIDAFGIRQVEGRRSGPENQWVTARMFAGIIASTLVLPAFVPFFEAFRLRSPALFLVGLFFLIGFGVSYYVLLRCFLEADIASETETAQHLPTKTVDETLVVVTSDGAFAAGRSRGHYHPDLSEGRIAISRGTRHRAR